MVGYRYRSPYVCGYFPGARRLTVFLPSGSGEVGAPGKEAIKVPVGQLNDEAGLFGLESQNCGGRLKTAAAARVGKPKLMRR